MQRKLSPLFELNINQGGMHYNQNNQDINETMEESYDNK